MNLTKTRYNDDTYLTIKMSQTNPNDDVFLLSYDSELIFPILDRQDKYNVCVDTLSIPTSNIPIWLPAIQPYPNTNVDLTEYSITISYNDVYSDETFLLFQSQNPNKHVNPITSFNPNANYESGYYGVYTYTYIVYMINTTLASAFSNLSGKTSLPANSSPPFLTINLDTYQFELSGQVNFYDDTLVTPINVFMNYSLFTLLNTLPFEYLGDDNGLPTNGRDFRLFFGNYYNNTYVPSFITTSPTSDDYYYRMVQNISSLANFSPVTSLTIISASLAVKPDYIPSKPSITSNNPSIIGQENILIEFEPIIKRSTEVIGQNIIYRPQFYRPKALSSVTSLRRIDVKIYWRDYFGTLHPIYANNGEQCIVRLAFTDKNKDF